jgi:hypothetical protein
MSCGRLCAFMSGRLLPLTPPPPPPLLLQATRMRRPKPLRPRSLLHSFTWVAMPTIAWAHPLSVAVWQGYCKLPRRGQKQLHHVLPPKQPLRLKTGATACPSPQLCGRGQFLAGRYAMLSFKGGSLRCVRSREPPVATAVAKLAAAALTERSAGSSSLRPLRAGGRHGTVALPPKAPQERLLHGVWTRRCVRRDVGRWRAIVLWRHVRPRR